MLCQSYYFFLQVPFPIYGAVQKNQQQFCSGSTSLLFSPWLDGWFSFSGFFSRRPLLGVFNLHKFWSLPSTYYLHWKAYKVVAVNHIEKYIQTSFASDKRNVLLIWQDNMATGCFWPGHVIWRQIYVSPSKSLYVTC